MGYANYPEQQPTFRKVFMSANLVTSGDASKNIEYRRTTQS